MGTDGRRVGVRYTDHAREQMADRPVSERQVERTIAAPTRAYPSSAYPDRTVAERVTATGNTRRVVYVEQPGTGGTVALVITVIRIAPRRRG